ncbi:MAG: hypothetical protein A2915_03105 [Candidatus Yanofskybacteria bacterium RIFCSPLOWO2_01_FULL_41_34]|uniref:Uncharacterized protein n=1 Tax=Candidatus Yanofskybacteria bacterium RIFCSPHIGHO2_01_FULL_41_26 TaxID=1802661 RepID=A0A1F8EE91_9BACT|nr:MAG: hypothetical protein A2649_01000 [Candidatus Yanofskybacteria bacterium RIFCSPHIGHO2_01_FULL_41_26]OGN21023.1 MAG: hypothetical protein A2915_03105 [Candidatus Yanofskybacteria bacterium RIFCSPLOWO2_01_FULL_41_34]
MDKILKGNYKIPGLKDTDAPKEEKPVSLGEEFEAAALKKLGGSITFVKKDFTWRGTKDDI